MNMNQIINMVVRILMRKAIHKGVNAGIGAASDFSRRRTEAKGGANADTDQPRQNAGPRPQLNEEKRKAKRAMQMANRASRITKL